MCYLICMIHFYVLLRTVHNITSMYFFLTIGAKIQYMVYL